ECCKLACYDRKPATPHDLWTLVNVLARLSTDQTQLYKRALKLRYCLKVKGWEPKSVGDVLFLAELTPEEAAMPQNEFYTLMTGFEQASEQKPARKKRAPNKSYLAKLAADSLPRHCPAANA